MRQLGERLRLEVNLHLLHVRRVYNSSSINRHIGVSDASKSIFYKRIMPATDRPSVWGTDLSVGVCSGNVDFYIE